LQFLLAKGLVHRLESLNAFVGCDRPARRHAGHFLICDGCGRILEMASAGLERVIAREASDAGFTVFRSVVEVRGRCPGCREPSTPAATGPYPPER
jgi:Fur family zinc uptake transcriptional regulator